MEPVKLNNSLAENANFMERIGSESGQPVQKCYQCGKCTAGCPVAFAMDYTPNQVMRMVQLGLRDEVLKSRTIWLCATCATCATRCPRNINLTQVMESLRMMAGEAGVTPPERARNVALFYDCFLDTVEKYGRLFEFGSMFKYNLKSRQPFRDAEVALVMLRKGKLKLTPSRIKGTGEMSRIFTGTRRGEGDGK